MSFSQFGGRRAIIMVGEVRSSCGYCRDLGTSPKYLLFPLEPVLS